MGVSLPSEDNPGCLPEGGEGEVTDLGDSEGPPGEEPCGRVPLVTYFPSQPQSLQLRYGSVERSPQTPGLLVENQQHSLMA